MIAKTEAFVRDVLGNDSSGHDWHHIDRVRKNALHILAREQEGDPFIIEMAALLHDIPDEKLNATEEAGWRKLDAFLNSVRLENKAVQHIRDVIESVSFKGGRKIELATIEAKIVQDADRLDAIGAIGIARAFAFGGKKGRPMYEPGFTVRTDMTVEEYRNGTNSTVQHFYEKLLLLKDLMNTQSAKQIAEARHSFMESFLDQFYSEWNGHS
ncbi:HD domain-containing protein [Bacillus sp. T33-2]|uniref:HD domain-containing protein n=1 Tax=Bacillus sp. T33-2 TaxID=2054168 RepID=UPI000C7819F4|nr:HD domain-containing protein [Bacillus sp. T33-2]PLR98934.1 phosphohydrolase [Bacillus sp. T33-2]